MAHVIYHGLQGFILKKKMISKVGKLRQTVSVIFCGSGSVT